MEYDFETVHRSILYYQAGDAISRLSEELQELLDDETDVDDYILTYCILRQGSDLVCRIEKIPDDNSIYSDI